MLNESFDYQWLIAWRYCVEALLPATGADGAVTAVGVEQPRANPFDDIVVYRESVPSTYIQVKYTATAEPVDLDFLGRPSRPGGSSFLLKAARRWIDWQTEGFADVNLILITNRHPDPTDELLKKRARNGLLVHAGVTFNPNTKWGKACADWAAAAEVSVEQLLDLLSHWVFDMGRQASNIEQETRNLMYRAGMRDDDTALALGVAWVRKAAEDNRNNGMLSLAMIRNAVDTRGLRRTQGPSTIGEWQRTTMESRVLGYRNTLPGELVGDDWIAGLCNGITEDWRDRLMRSVDRVVSALADTGADWADVDELNWSDTYPSIVNALRELEVGKVWQRLPAASARDDDLIRALNHIAVQCRAPHYGVCLAISGSWGAGKTRLLVELADRYRTRGDATIFLDSDAPAGTLQDRLQRAVADLTGADVPTLKHVVDVLNDSQIKLLVCIDAIHRLHIADLRTFRDMVSVLTTCRGLRWAVTGDPLRYDKLAEAGGSSFWVEYGTGERADAEVTTTGWIDLDVVNERRRTGLVILEQHVNEQQRLDLSEIRRHPDQFRRAIAILCNPRLARMQAAELAENVDRLVTNVHRASLVDRYWKDLGREIAQERADRVHLEAILTHWAATVFVATSYAVPYQLLMDDTLNSLSPTGLDRKEITALTERLREYGVVAIDDPQSVSQSADAPVRPTNDVLWGYRIATSIVERLRRGDSATAVVKQLQPWGQTAQDGDPLAESVAQFGFSLLPWDVDAADATREVWFSWISDRRLPAFPLQIAALEAAEESEAIVIAGLSNSGKRTVSPTRREAFVQTRFTAMAKSSFWSAKSRLMTLRPHYPLLGDAGLGHYAAHTVQTILRCTDLTSGNDVVAYLEHLCGTEEARFAATAAAEMVQCLDTLMGSDVGKWLAPLTTFLKKSTLDSYFPVKPPRNKRRYPEVDASLGLQMLLDDDIYFFWEHLVHQAIRAMVRREGIAAFELLKNAGWIDGRSGKLFAPVVSDRIRKQLNVTLGGHLRDHRFNADEQTEFFDLVSALVDGRALDTPVADQRGRAFFMIRHTEITRGRDGFPVAAFLHGPLRVICEDPTVQTGRYREPMMRENGLE